LASKVRFSKVPCKGVVGYSSGQNKGQLVGLLAALFYTYCLRLDNFSFFCWYNMLLIDFHSLPNLRRITVAKKTVNKNKGQEDLFSKKHRDHVHDHNAIKALVNGVKQIKVKGKK